MGALFDVVLDQNDLKQKVEASQSKLRAAAQHERARNAQLLEVLDDVEKALVHYRQRIRHLEETKGRTLEAFRQLRSLLHDRQTGSWPRLRRCLAPRSYAARAELILRLDLVIATLAPDAQGADGDSDDAVAKSRANSNETAPAQREGGPGFVESLLWLPVKAPAAVVLFVGSAVAEALVARKANSGTPLGLVKKGKSRRLPGGIYVRLS